MLSGVPVLARPLHGFTRHSSACDIVQGNSWNAFAFKEEVPLVVTEHHVIDDPAFNPYKTIPQKIYHRWIYHCERKSLKVADAVICVSRFTAKRLEEVYDYHNASVIYNGIDTTTFLPKPVTRSAWNIPDNRVILFFAGNLSKRKGGDLLPKIMKVLGDDFLLLVSSGQKETSVEGAGNILNLGKLSLEQLVEVYNLCDIFLSPSRLEGFGLSIAEAMSCGKPVVATNCSAIPELVVDGKGGFLCVWIM